MAITVSRITPNAGQFIKNGDNISFSIKQAATNQLYDDEISVYALTSNELLNNNWFIYTRSTGLKVWMIETSTLFQRDLVKLFPAQQLDTSFNVPFILNNNILELDKSGLFDYTVYPIDNVYGTTRRIIEEHQLLPASWNPLSHAIQYGLRWRDYFSITFPPHNDPWSSPPIISSWVGGNTSQTIMDNANYLDRFGLLEQMTNNRRYYNMKTAFAAVSRLVEPGTTQSRFFAKHIAVSPSYWSGGHPSGYSSDSWYVDTLPDGWESQTVNGKYQGAVTTV